MRTIDRVSNDSHIMKYGAAYAEYEEAKMNGTNRRILMRQRTPWQAVRRIISGRFRPAARMAVLSGFVCIVTVGSISGLGIQSAIAAENNEISVAAALLGATTGTDEGLGALQQYLSQFSGRPEQLEEQAKNLIKALGSTKITDDPVALQDAITSIAQAARKAIFATPIAKVRVARNFNLSPRSIGFDFGPPDSTVMPNFQHITAKDKRLSGKNRRALRRPSDDQLLADGVVNVEKFATDVPNGKYRVVLLTDNLGIGKKFEHPLGRKLKVNGNDVNIAQNTPRNWLNEGYLTGDTAKIGGSTDGAQRSGQATADATRKAEAVEIPVGSTQRVVSLVRGVLQANVRKLVLKDEVFSDEKINTGPNSATRLIFQDNTVLSIGANSSVTLDEFVFDTKGSKSKVSLSLTKGVMRFVTGNLSKDRYSIRTPTATIGIRGTILEISVADNGATTTRVTEGAAMVRAGGRTETVRSGFSTTTRRGQRPTPPKPNPPTPPQVETLRTALGPEPAPAEITAAAEQVAAAAVQVVAEAAAKVVAAKEAKPKEPGNKNKNADEETGGMVIVEVEVVDGKLVIDFDNLDGLSTYLTAIIVAPANEPSNFDLGEEVGKHYRDDRKRLVATNARIDEQIGAVLSEIATAAGPQQVAEALGIQQPTVEPNSQISPN